MALRATFWMAAGVIVGFVLGGIPARREAKALRGERDALQAKLDAAGSSSVLQALLPRMDLGPDPTSAPPRANEAVDDARPDGEPQARTAQAPAQSSPPPRPNPDRAASPEPEQRGASSDGTRPARDSARMLDQFDQYAIAQRARTAAARAALIEQAGLEPAALARLDQSLSRMNEALREHADEVLAVIATRKEPTPLQMLGIGHDLSGVLYDGQRELETVVGDAAPSVDRSALEIWNYVDVASWQPLVKDKLSALARDGSSAGTAGRTAVPEE